MPKPQTSRNLSRQRRPGRAPQVIESLEPRILFAAAPAYNFASLVTLNRPVTGGQPEGLVMDSSGDLYGVTANGGANRFGTIFEIPAHSTTLLVLATFDGTDGARPIGNLVLDAQGNLFGTTQRSGSSDKGTVFELAANDTSHTITTLVSFDGANGVYPIAGLVESGGNLYGTTYGQGVLAGSKSTLFEVAPNGSASTLTVLATFGPRNFPDGTVVVDGQGNIFGTTRSGGTQAVGSIFEVVAGSQTVTTLASFKGTNGAHPVGTLLSDGQGDFFGITTNGGALAAGTVFKYADGVITTVASFNGTDGAHPVGNLIEDASGNFFGVTATGGANLTGTVFELPAGTASKLTIVYSLRGVRTGYDPSGPLVMDPNTGNLFGTTFLGGTQSGATGVNTLNGGTIFELLPAGETLSAERLVFTKNQSQPGNAIANHTLPHTLVVQIEDVFGNLITTDNSDITLAIGTGPAGATLAGQVTVAAQNGVATFTDVSLPTAGTYTLVATEGPIVSLPSKSFQIFPDATSAHLVLATSPTNPATRSTLTPAAVVKIEDAFGNVITSYHSRISWTVVSGPIGGTLSGIASVNAVAGKATFGALSLSVPGTTGTASYTLQIAGPGLAPIQLMQDIVLSV